MIEGRRSMIDDRRSNARWRMGLTVNNMWRMGLPQENPYRGQRKSEHVASNTSHQSPGRGEQYQPLVPPRTLGKRQKTMS